MVSASELKERHDLRHLSRRRERAYEPGVSGLDIANRSPPRSPSAPWPRSATASLSISPTRSTKTLGLEFIARDDPRALELIRHDAAHVLAEAVQSLWPGAQVTIGPVIENGFYYDFFRNEPFTPEDFPAIEKRMREIIARDKPFTKRSCRATRPKSFFEEKGRSLQDRADRRHSRRSGGEAL